MRSIINILTILLVTLIWYLLFTIMPVFLIVYIVLNLIGFTRMTKSNYEDSITSAISNSQKDLRVTIALQMYALGIYGVLLAVLYVIVYQILAILIPYTVDSAWFLPIPVYYFNVGIALVATSILTTSIIQYLLVRPHMGKIKKTISEIIEKQSEE